MIVSPMTATSLQHLSSADVALQRAGWGFSNQDPIPSEMYPSGEKKWHLSLGPSLVEILQASFLSSVQQPHAAARGVNCELLTFLSM